MLDQLGFAMQLEKKDVAVKAVMAKDLTEETIVSAIEEMNRTYEAKKKNAEELSEKIRSENGVDEAVRLIETVIQPQ